MTSPDPRAHARRTIEAMFAIGDEPIPPRRCPSCGHEAATLDARCPSCGKRYDRKLPWLSDRARIAIAALVLVVVAGAVTYSAPRISESNEARTERLAREEAERVRRERARLTKLQRPVAGRAVLRDRRGDREPRRLATRRALVTAMEGAILDEILVRHDRGEISGSRPREVVCGPLVRRSVGGRPVGEGEEEDLERRRGRYDCTAVQREVHRFGRIIGLFGVPVVGTIDFAAGTWTFCQDTKIPGERGKPLARVRLAPECLGAEQAQALGNGYIAPED